MCVFFVSHTNTSDSPPPPLPGHQTLGQLNWITVHDPPSLKVSSSPVLVKVAAVETGFNKAAQTALNYRAAGCKSDCITTHNERITQSEQYLDEESIFFIVALDSLDCYVFSFPHSLVDHSERASANSLQRGNKRRSFRRNTNPQHTTDIWNISITVGVCEYTLWQGLALE